MGSRRTIIPLLILLLPFLPAETNLTKAVRSNSHAGNSSLICDKKERNALLTFKVGLKDTSNMLSSWVGENCCNWFGVGCSNRTGRVTKLDLHGQLVIRVLGRNDIALLSWKQLGGKLSPSLLDLKYLTYLDLSSNDFQRIPIPRFLGSLTNLRYLDLSGASFGGMVPPNIGNLSKLRHLDLATFTNPRTLWVSDLHWLPNLSSLKYLNLGGVNLSRSSTDWLQTVNMLPSLLELHLSTCSLDYYPESLPSLNFTSLSFLDLSSNEFSSLSFIQWLSNITTLTYLGFGGCDLRGPIPEVPRGCLCNLRTLDLSRNYYINGDIQEIVDAISGCGNVSLDYLDLSYNKLGGNLPNSLGYFKHMEYLHLSYNLFSGPVPPSIVNLSSLVELDLSFNKLSGMIPEGIGQLTRLVKLSLWGNSWEGVISEIHLLNLTNLSEFSISSSNKSLAFNIARGWIPPFNLYSIEIDNCQVGPSFPAWLRNQTESVIVTVRNAGISDKIPYWFWKSSRAQFLDFSNNQISGVLPNSVSFSPGAQIDLGFNSLEGSLPIWPNATCLSLRNNLLSGPIPISIGQGMPDLQLLDLSRNFLNGSIPPSFREMSSLGCLDLSHNKLSGEISEPLMGLERLGILDLSNNSLSGKIPSQMCSQLPGLNWLRLRGNSLSGDISTLFHNCTGLSTLDLGENIFSGSIPIFIAPDLSLLSLRSNMLRGNIPKQLCRLRSLHILDLANNNLSGIIPKCLGSESAGLKNPEYFFVMPPSTQPEYFSQRSDLVVKGRLIEYTKIISLVNLIDLSSNNLSGYIPEELTNLSRLGALNLSRNHLIGTIPQNIGNLQLLETLDLSWNHLSGRIPPSMSSMTSLNYLNLSHNNLSGPIPSANQFQTLNDPWIYGGNPDLCGPPLPTKCSSSSNSGNLDVSNDRDQNADRPDNDHDTLWFYVSLALGYVVGFWTVCGALLINKYLRHAYFKSADAMKEKLMVFIAINMVRLRRKMNIQSI